jgi:carbamoyltransferase
MVTYTLSFHTTHNAGATLLADDRIVAAASEERFNRVKHYASLPYRSIQFCLSEADIEPQEIDRLVVPSDVVTWGVRTLLDWNQYNATNVSQGDQPLVKRVRKQVAEQLRRFKRETSVPDYARPVEFPESTELLTINHHEAHAASAYYTSGFEDSLVVTSDGLGDDISLTVWHGTDGELEEFYRVGKEGSLGWFYGVVTQALGWWVGNGEGKTMGLSSFGDAPAELIEELRELCPGYANGTLSDPSPIDYADEWHERDTYHFDFDETEFVSDLLARYDRADIADATQQLLEEQLIELVDHWLDEVDTRNVALAGGVFLNVAVNRELLSDLDIDGFHAFPAAGDAGLPVGAALGAVHGIDEVDGVGSLEHPNLGPGFTDSEIEATLSGRKLDFHRPSSITDAVAERLLDGSMVAWFQGRMEYGPRALGNRSILVDPRLEDGKDRVNAEVKFRESWRPFAPSVLVDAAEEYFVDPYPDPFMITSFEVRSEKRDEIPAVTHVDGTSRPQFVKPDGPARYYDLIETFNSKGGVPLVLNTSFNLSGDPIVCSVDDAIETFYNCGLDAMAIGPYLLEK